MLTREAVKTIGRERYGLWQWWSFRKVKSMGVRLFVWLYKVLADELMELESTNHLGISGKITAYLIESSQTFLVNSISRTSQTLNTT